MHATRYLAALLIAIATFSVAHAGSWNVEDFGAKGDSQTLNTGAIQEAIDTCSQTGGGEVLISDGIYVAGTILLKDGVTLIIHESATLLGSENPADYQSIDAFVDGSGQERGRCLIGALDAKDVGLGGSGTIDGRGASFKRDKIAKTLEKVGIHRSQLEKPTASRPFLVRFVRSQDIKIRDINLRQPAAWTCHFFQCDKIDAVTLENIYITLPGGGRKKHASLVVEEQETAYPEFSLFGPLPAYGLFARHIQTLNTKNLVFKTTSPDKRRKILPCS